MSSDVKVVGKGTILGGEYDNITIDGAGKIEGHVDAKETIKVLGTCKSKGSVRAKKIDLDGIAHFYGDLDSDILQIDGTLKCDQDMVSDEIKVKGSLSCQGDIKANSIKVSGMFKSGKEVQAETFECDGFCSFKEANVGSLKIDGYYSINTVHADDVSIKMASGILKALKIVKKADIDVCECTTIEAEGMNCAKLYARDVKLGPLCTVNYLEYSGTAEISSKATVIEMKKVG